MRGACFPSFAPHPALRATLSPQAGRGTSAGTLPYALLGRRCGGAVLFAVVVVVVALLERVAVLLQVEVVEDRAEHRNVALAEPLGRAHDQLARRLAAVDAEHPAVRAGSENDRSEENTSE